MFPSVGQAIKDGDANPSRMCKCRRGQPQEAGTLGTHGLMASTPNGPCRAATTGLEAWSMDAT